MNKKAFTFVELVVSIVIIGILSAIGFISYISYLGDARDTQRKSDIAQLSSSLRLTKQQKGSFPIPGDYFNLMFNIKTNILAYQGKMNNNVILSNTDILPLDPLTKKPYSYSITKDKQEYQLALSLEKSEIPEAIVEGNYKSVSINILPSIVLAIESDPGTYVNIGTNENKFILSGQGDNLPYTFEEPFGPIANYNGSMSALINELKEKNLYWQNSDFTSCDQIKEAGKTLGNGTNEYQIIDPYNGQLMNTNCTF